MRGKLQKSEQHYCSFPEIYFTDFCSFPEMLFILYHKSHTTFVTNTTKLP